jgi:hypothetical protein
VAKPLLKKAWQNPPPTILNSLRFKTAPFNFSQIYIDD